MVRLFLALALSALATPALACMFDTDCEPGSQCVKSAGDLEGFCAGGISPGNSNDRQPYSDPLDLNDTAGNTCMFNTDCGPGSRCLKSGLYGVCVR